MAAVPTTANSARPAQPLSEGVREREAFRYAPAVFTHSRFYRDGQRPPTTDLTTATDSVLTAIAQLGTYQTRTERAYVSLFDSTYQYIVAEAAPSIPIAPAIPSDSCPVPLSLCGTAIPRNQGSCDHLLSLTTSFDGCEASELPLSLVPNMAADPRFSSRPYRRSSCFYAGVPIRTRRGIDIGVYCVTNSTPHETWDEQCTRSLRDISRAIMTHLELNRASVASRLHERMNRGLGSFVEGKTTLAGWQSGPNREAFMDKANFEGALDAKQQRLERLSPGQNPLPGTHSWTGTPLITGLQSTPDRSFATSSDTGYFDFSRKSRKSNTAEQSSATGSTSGEADGHGRGRIFSRAANIVREAFEIEGCVFLDVKVGSYKRATNYAPRQTSDAIEATDQSSAASSSDESTVGSPDNARDAVCNLLGFSATDGSSINGETLMSGNTGAVPSKFLAKLPRRYPRGKIFNFDAIGELQSSDSSEDDGWPQDQGIHPSADAQTDGTALRTSGTKQHDQPYGRAEEGKVIHRAFPSARSVAFIPIWDAKRERWFAGGFIYTLIPTRVFSLHGELSLFQAFGRLIAADVLDLELSMADKAKSDVLGALSHEIRSPLHGVILGTELLSDTDLSVFQENATHTIETCCRTMLDTIDHLLDYSKVNSFASKQDQKPNFELPRYRDMDTPGDLSKMSVYRCVRLDGLLQEVATAVFAGFNFQYMSVRQLSKQGRSEHMDVAAHHRLDSMRSKEQLGQGFASRGSEEKSVLGNISVFLIIDPSCNWVFNVQPGAIRRIIMNLLGNSLRYTDSGTIRISLAQEPASPRRSKPDRVVKLTVHDTGRGIGADYMQHKLFKPFSQEDELAPGTGLGLSLVKKIVSQLRGHISIESELGVGTTATITLPLEQPLQAPDAPAEVPDDYDDLFDTQVRELTGLRVYITGFRSIGRGDEYHLVEDMCRRWLKLDLVSDQEKFPDVILWSEDMLPESLQQIETLAKTPNVVICQDALAAYKALTWYEDAGRDGIFEFISQPVGPRILANAILLAYKRWAGLSKSALPPAGAAGTTRARSSHVERAGTSATKIWDLHSPPLRPAGLKRSRSSDAKLPTSATVGKLPPTKPAIQEEAKEPLPAKPQDDASSELQKGSTDAKGLADGATQPKEEESIGKFLLVDDNHINLKILIAYMGKLGRSYATATNGKEALDIYEKHPAQFSGILMDISMPVMDGMEAARRIRAHERRNHLPAVTMLALTGLASLSAHQDALESGFDVFLTKPVKLKVLSEVLESVGLHAGSAAGA